MLFRRDDLAGLGGGLYDQFFIERLDGADVDDLRVDSIFCQHVRRLDGGGHAQAVGDDTHVLAFADDAALANLEIVILIENYRHRGAAKADVDRPFVLDSGSDCFSRLRIICGAHDDHSGDLAHERQVLQTLVGSAVLTDSDAGVCRADLHVQVRVADRVADLLIGAARREHREGACKRHHTGGREACRDAHHIAFRDSAVKVSVGICFRKDTGFGRTCQVCVKYYKIGHLRAQLQKSFSV